MTADEHRKKALRSRRDLEAAIFGLETHPDMMARNRLWKLAERAIDESDTAGYHAGREDQARKDHKEAG